MFQHQNHLRLAKHMLRIQITYLIFWDVFNDLNYAFSYLNYVFELFEICELKKRPPVDASEQIKQWAPPKDSILLPL